MTCAECWADIPHKAERCPRCGATAPAADRSFGDLLRTHPWLVVLVVLSALVMMWAATL